MRSIVIPCFNIQGITLLWTRCFAHSNNGGQPGSVSCTRSRFPLPQQGSTGHWFRLHRGRVSAGMDEPEFYQQPSTLNPTTNPLTAAALIYAPGAGITAGAGTRLVLQLLLAGGFWYPPFQAPHSNLRRNWYSSSLPPQCWEWAIFAPAALRGSSSRFSGSLSGIEP